MAVTKSPRLGLDRWSAGTDLHPNRAEWDAQQGRLDDLVAIDVEVATFADRPAPKRGVYMWVVDEQRLYRSTATGWVTTAKIGGGGRGTQITIGAASAAVEGASAFAARADHTHNLPLATSTVDGAMSRADKAKLDAATPDATPGTVVSRSSSGGVFLNAVALTAQPVTVNHATRKDYVDASVAARFPFALSAGSGSINDILTEGQYQQPSASPVTTANGYPINGGAGVLLVWKFGSGAWVMQEWLDWGNRRRFLRATNGGATGWSAWREFAGTETATASADGLLAKADKALIDTATSAATANALVRRGANGEATFTQMFLDASAPLQANHAARKDYVDATARAEASAAASSAVGAIPLASSTVDGLMSKSDKGVLDTATSNSVSNALVRRTPAGDVAVPSAPSSPSGATSKAYVDAGDARQVTAATAIPDAADLNTYQTDGFYIQSQNVQATNGSNYPVPLAGFLAVSNLGAMTFQTYQTYNGSSGNKVYVRGRYNTGWSAWQELAYTDLATSSTDGLMPRADKAKLDGATSADTASSMMIRDSSGRARVKNPSSSLDIANKSYVDAQDAATGNDAKMWAESIATSKAAFSAVHAPTSVAASTNANTLTAPGLYSYPAQSAALNNNTPSTASAVLEVLSNGGQELIQKWDDGVATYVRSYVAQSFPIGAYAWTSWQKLTNTRDFKPLDFQFKELKGGQKLTSVVPSDVGWGLGGAMASDLDARRYNAQTGVIEGWWKGVPVGGPVANGLSAGFVKDPIWKVDVRPEGLDYTTQRIELLDCQPKFMIGFAWERVYNPGASKWGAWACVAGDTQDIPSVSRAIAEATTEEPLIHNTSSAGQLYTSSSPYTIRRIGQNVYLTGAATSTSSGLTGSNSDAGANLGWFVQTSESAATVPGADYTLMPYKFDAGVQQGSGSSRWCTAWYPRNSLRAYRYDGSPGSRPWLYFNMVYPALPINTYGG